MRQYKSISLHWNNSDSFLSLADPTKWIEGHTEDLLAIATIQLPDKYKPLAKYICRLENQSVYFAAPLSEAEFVWKEVISGEVDVHNKGDVRVDIAKQIIEFSIRIKHFPLNDVYYVKA